MKGIPSSRASLAAIVAAYALSGCGQKSPNTPAPVAATPAPAPAPVAAAPAAAAATVLEIPAAFRGVWTDGAEGCARYEEFGFPDPGAKITPTQLTGNEVGCTLKSIESSDAQQVQATYACSAEGEDYDQAYVLQLDAGKLRIDDRPQAFERCPSAESIADVPVPTFAEAEGEASEGSTEESTAAPAAVAATPVTDATAQAAAAEELRPTNGQDLATVRAAAEKGDTVAQYELATRYGQGQGMPQDMSQSAQWARRAAEGGHAAAQYTLAQMLGDGLGVAADPVEGYAWAVVADRNWASSMTKDVMAQVGEALTPAQKTDATRRAEQKIRAMPAVQKWRVGGDGRSLSQTANGLTLTVQCKPYRVQIYLRTADGRVPMPPGIAESEGLSFASGWGQGGREAEEVAEARLDYLGNVSGLLTALVANRKFIYVPGGLKATLHIFDTNALALALGPVFAKCGAASIGLENRVRTVHDEAV